MSRTIFIFIIYFSLCSYALGQNFQLKNIGVEQGLSNESVWSIAQDKNGYMWFGTSAGLDRYDGKEFKHYTTKDGLPENEVLEIFTDKTSNRLYLQTFSNSFCYYENGEIINEKKNKELGKFKSSRTQSKLIFDGIDSENKFIYTDIKQYAIRSANLEHSFIVDTFNVGEIMKLFFKEKQLYALVDNGKNTLVLIKAYSKSRYEIINEWSNIDNPEIVLKAERKNKCIIYDTYHNIYFFDKNTFQLIKIAKAKTDITSICIDKDSILWYGKNDGVWYVDLKSKNEKHTQLLKGTIITNLFEDKVGNIWISTIDKGVYVLNTKSIHSKVFEHNGVVEPVNKLLCFGGKFVYGHANNNFSEQVNGELTYKLYNQNKNFNRTLGYIKMWNRYFIYSEFNIYDYSKGKVFHTENAIKNVLLQNDSTLLIATARGLFKGTLYKQSILKNYSRIFTTRVTALCSLSTNQILLGNLNDLYIYNLQSQAISKLTLPAWCATIKVNKIIKHTNGDAWILTSNQGIVIYKNNKLFKLKDAGLFDEQNLKCLSFDSETTAWVGTENGLYKIYYSGLQITRFERLEVTEGLLSKKINDTFILNDTLYVANAGGVNYFNIKNYNSLKQFPIIIKQIVVNDSLQFAQTFPQHLSPIQNSISITYAALYYGKTKNIIYYYRLLGASNGWKTTLENTLDFSALKSNTYTFQVYAVDKNNSQIKSNIVSYSFEIEPHFYETTWFYIIIILLVVVLIVLLIMYNNHRQKLKFTAQNELNKKMNALELKALQSQLDPHFIFNSINAIKDYLNKNDADSTDKYLDEFAYLIRNTLDNSRHTTILLSQEIKYLKSYLKLEQLRSNNRFSFSITADDSVETEIVSIPTMMLQPFAENCVRHGKVGSLDYQGNILIHFALVDEDRIKCTVTDNGVGLDESKIKTTKQNTNMRSHALQIQRERINLYNQTADVKIEFSIANRTDNLKGTIVEIILPILFYENLYNNNN